MNRRTFLKSFAVTATGILVPSQVLAEPASRIWQLDRTMVSPRTVRLRQEDFPDDADFIQWFINDATSRGEWAYIPTGTYIIDRTIFLPDNAKVNGQGSTFIAGKGIPKNGSVIIMRRR